MSHQRSQREPYEIDFRSMSAIAGATIRSRGHAPQHHWMRVHSRSVNPGHGDSDLSRDVHNV